ncbi:DUF2341 domain-containing protein [Tepidicaulis sp. LMO-SS28]|uniref:DUF2341 domain-containing protein n=1 Tax=Tepidicaulis sp. LMO-SS28 TaxID=3447455 RepID=UPI003EE048FC
MKPASFLAACFSIFMVFAATEAKAWWNDDWELRKQLSIDTSQTGANINGEIGTSAVLVRLHIGNFRFEAAKEDGSDLRFVAGDDQTPLKYHIERYDGLLGEAFIWVQMPDLKPGTKNDIWLYYGNPKAASAEEPKATYGADKVLVYHFQERGTPAQDTSSWANHALTSGVGTDGSIISRGLRLDETSWLRLPASPSLALAEGGAFTWSAWIKPDALQQNAAIYHRSEGMNSLTIGLDEGAPFVEIGNNGTLQRTGLGTPVSPASWHHLAVVSDGTTVRLYLDGAPYAEMAAVTPILSGESLLGALPAPVSPPAAEEEGAEEGEEADEASAEEAVEEEVAGADAADAQAGEPVVPLQAFVGEIDELNVSKIARPAGYIAAAAVGQGPDHGQMISFSPDEETSSWLSGYFAIILKSVTIDGWVVIVILMVMAVISWIVMYQKAAYVNSQVKANDRFLDEFHKAASDLTALDQGDPNDFAAISEKLQSSDRKILRNSSFYRIYHVGADEISHRLRRAGTGRDLILTPQSIEAIRASIDTVVVQETQKLNRMMVLLTIAISGGPFLGLLGTVVGVMITFAAIAASGDVNVNSIAPGVAAALVATVAGLFVAIPALFGYNYLLTRVKDITNEMRVFVDEFVTKMAETYQGQPGYHTRAAE